jgi:hypothetical protein
MTLPNTSISSAQVDAAMSNTSLSNELIKYSIALKHRYQASYVALSNQIIYFKKVRFFWFVGISIDFNLKSVDKYQVEI